METDRMAELEFEVSRLRHEVATMRGELRKVQHVLGHYFEANGIPKERVRRSFFGRGKN